MNPRILVALALLAAFAMVGMVLAVSEDEEDGGQTSGPRRFEGATLPRSFAAPDFALTDQDGRRVTMRQFRGRPVIVTFLYTTCEDTCPTQAQQIKGALDDLSERVPALAIAVDPPRDNPERARAFLSEQRMTGRMTFALGSRSELARVWKGFAVQPQRDDLEHTARIVLVDSDGIQRAGFPVDQVTPERLAHDLRLLLEGA